MYMHAEGAEKKDQAASPAATTPTTAGPAETEEEKALREKQWREDLKRVCNSVSLFHS